MEWFHVMAQKFRFGKKYSHLSSLNINLNLSYPVQVQVPTRILFPYTFIREKNNMFHVGMKGKPIYWVTWISLFNSIRHQTRSWWNAHPGDSRSPTSIVFSHVGESVSGFQNIAKSTFALDYGSLGSRAFAT